MTETREVESFPDPLERLFEAPSPGLQDPGLEARILARVLRRRRLRAGVLALAAITGAGITGLSLNSAHPSGPRLKPVLDMLTGNSLIEFLYASLGAGGVIPVVVAGGLTLLGLALVRVLEEV